ncbi:MAG: hypothetical protein JXB38_20935 [Anaerolineales bacterium]|nr:hypothetical protein [Anaerolineales bacterium]
MANKATPIPVFTTSGDVEAYLVYPMIYNRLGEWIGFVTPQRDVYSVTGDYVGWMNDDPRILRKRTYNYDKPKLKPPPPQGRISIGSSMRLPPMMAELSYDTIDILLDDRERLHTLDAGEFRPDMD